MNRIQTIQKLQLLLRDEKLRLLADEIQPLSQTRPKNIEIFFQYSTITAVPYFTELRVDGQRLSALTPESLKLHPHLNMLIIDLLETNAGHPDEPVAFSIPQHETPITARP